MIEATLYHNPRCSKSREALALIRAAGIEPRIVEYLKDGWTTAQLKGLIKRIGGSARDILRDKEPLAAELGLLDPALRDATILAAMVKHPILVERPILETAKGVVVARPPERVAEVLG
jgi:arsenate reductase